MPHIGMDRTSLYRLYKRYVSVEMVFFALSYMFEISGFWAKKDSLKPGPTPLKPLLTPLSLQRTAHCLLKHSILYLSLRARTNGYGTHQKICFPSIQAVAAGCTVQMASP